MKLKKVLIMSAISVACAGIGIASPLSASAKMEDAWHMTICQNDQVNVKGYKMTVYGQIDSSSTKNGLWRDSVRHLKEKKRIFKLTRKTRYYSLDETERRISKKEWTKLVHANEGLGLYFKTENGKVVKAGVSS